MTEQANRYAFMKRWDKNKNMLNFEKLEDDITSRNLDNDIVNNKEGIKKNYKV